MTSTHATIPKDWKQINLERECSFERGMETGADAYNTEGVGDRFIRVVDVTGSRDTPMFVDGIHTTKRVKKEDILLTLDGTVGAVIRGLEGIYSTGVRKVSFRDAQHSGRLLYYILQSANVQRTIDLYASGSTIKHASAAIPHLVTAVPEALKEQEKIADVLELVDQAIDKTDALIKKYERIRAGMMQDLFRYGVDDDGHLRGAAANWQMMPLGDVAKVSNGTTPSMARKDYWEKGTVPWLSSGKINEYVILTPSELVTKRALKETSLKLFPKDTVLLAMVGQGKTRGMSARLEFPSTINQNLAGIIPSQRLDAKFLHYYLDHHYSELRAIGRGSNQDALTCSLIQEYVIPVPSLDEQKRISGRLFQLEEQMNKETELKTKLSQIKNGLMSDLLTGTVRTIET